MSTTRYIDESFERVAVVFENRELVLDLSFQLLTELPDLLGQLFWLEELSIAFNRLTELPEFISRLTQLRRLDLSGNELDWLPASIGQLTQLRSLNISRNQLSFLPVNIGQLAQLEVLDLFSNELTQLPDSIGQLSQLKSLFLSENLLEAVPQSIRHLGKLPSVDLSRNRLTVLPESIGELTQLQELDVSMNLLTQLPQSIGGLTQLKRLVLHHNHLKSLPDSIGRLTQLPKLDLSENRLLTLPESIGELRRLQVLDISQNRVTKLPDSIGRLVQLNSFELQDNQMEELPESIGYLTQLPGLNLSKNLLKDLPQSIGQLTQLRSLNLADNRFTSLPMSLRRLRSLEELHLQGNGVSLPDEVLGLKPSEVLEYYFRILGGKRPLNEAKLILVGRGAVGKTSIVNRLVHGMFKAERKTEGIRITEWKLRVNANDDVRLNIWDFGGQEIMHATHQFFLTHRSLYLLVLNGRAGGEDADAEYWLKLIESFGGESPVIVVLNKIKEHPYDLNRRALRQKYPSIREFIRTDCEDATGIKELRKAIERETDRLEHLRDAFPASWFTIKDQLAGMEKNYLSFEEYRQLCEQHAETNQKAQEDLAGYLHILGIVLNYKDDVRLQDTHVLNPQWVTNGIYRILNSHELEKQRGEIRLHQLAEILDSAEYPANMRRFILDLMKKFDLCFSFPEDDTHYLIPELLDKQEPDQAAEFNPSECLNFQYHYPVMLEGLLPRFIVRTHALSEGLSRWRTGVILQFEAGRALVKADLQEKKVFISARGPLSGRRRLLAVIRSDFERIHRDIRNLQPGEMVPLPGYPDVVVPYRELLVMENNGVEKFQKVVGNEVVDLEVRDLLNGVDLEGTRRKSKTFSTQKETVRVFYSYSHRDEVLRNELESHLKLLQRRGLIETWYDRRIDPGDEFGQMIDENIEDADIILLLVSADFIASDYCYEKEMHRALQRHEQGAALVIPVIVRDVSWSKAPFAKLQALPKDALAVTRWPDRDSAWRNVAEGIERVVSQIRKSSQTID